ncbi:MAG: hypothetical protein A4S09_02185 [Proteobacteria bacterium SG_bin7]|nr:MAG: hypothetical protein A4S09_02185 [Proteobacteria bacterium SG_bin7]
MTELTELEFEDLKDKLVKTKQSVNTALLPTLNTLKTLFRNEDWTSTIRNIEDALVSELCLTLTKSKLRIKNGLK